MIAVYVLIKVESGEAWRIAEKVSMMDGVKMTHTVTGVYDIIAYAELENFEALKDLISSIQSIKGVERTHTAVSI